jgi:hypothetical protein
LVRWSPPWSSTPARRSPRSSPGPPRDLSVQAEHHRQAAEELERQPAAATRAREAAEREYQRLTLTRKALDTQRAEILEVMAAQSAR